MKSTKLFLTAILFFVLGFAQAQNDYNPWKKYGYTPPKALTLSDGKYQEFFDADTVVQIGSVLFNTVTNQVVAFIEYDTAYSEATLEPHVISRWLSPDPLAEEFPSWSPYNFVENNPIKNIDPDGRFPIDIIADLAFIGYDLFDMAKTKMSGGNISSTQYAALGADALGALIPYATGLGAGVRAGKTIVQVEHAATVGTKSTRMIEAEAKLSRAAKGTASDGVDFVVTKEGTAIPTSQKRMREGFDKAGFPKTDATKTSEVGQIHTVPTKNGKVDVRTMEGGSGGDKRAVFNTPGTNSPRTPNGKTPTGTKEQIRKDSHMNQKD
jgi:hypothetical protein